MHVIRRILFRLAAALRPGRADADLAREMHAHLRLLEDDFIARGMNSAEAGSAARRAFGGRIQQVQEEHRDERSFAWMPRIWLDLKLGLRMLARYPGLTAVAVLGMAVGIAICAAAFVIGHRLLDPSMPLDESDRIVAIQNWDIRTNNREPRALHDFLIWRDELTSVEDLGAFRSVPRNLIAPGSQPEAVVVAEISASRKVRPRAPATAEGTSRGSVRDTSSIKAMSS